MAARGRKAVAGYVPTPKQIRAACAKIQASWSVETEIVRRRGVPIMAQPGLAWTCPVYGTGQGITGSEAADGISWGGREAST